MRHRASSQRSVRQTTVGRRGVLSLLGLTLVSCHVPAQPAPEISADAGPPPEPPVVVLIAIDGVRWQDVYYGPTFKGAEVARSREQLIPNLVAMEEAGTTWGKPQSSLFFASGPNFVSLPGYMEMLSGTSSTSCTENDCKKMKQPTLLDDFQARTPQDPTRAAVFSSWPTIGVAASMHQSGVASTGRYGGYGHEVIERFPECRQTLRAARAEGGGHGGFRHDKLTAKLARAYLKEAKPDFLFVSLGETDEYGHEGDYPKYLRALRDADRFVGDIRSDLRAIEESGRDTLLLVTADHGRATNFNDHGRKHPESSRSFLFAEGSVVTAPAPRGGKAYLKDLAPTVRAVTGLPARTSSGRGRVLNEILL